jgi:hypothetical protein
MRCSFSTGLCERAHSPTGIDDNLVLSTIIGPVSPVTVEFG